MTVDVPTPDAPLDVDPIRLAQVLTNLLSNAAKFTASGGQLTLTARVSAEGVEFAVADTGRGLAPEMLERVFEMFTQGGQAGTGGLGIGLFLVRQLTELHGGHVRAASEGVGRGSRFVVTLPPSVLVSASGPRDTQNVEAAPRGRRILIVDDNTDAMESLRLLLELEGHTVDVASDGASALSVAASFQPEVVLLDIGLPGLNGYEVAQRLRARPEGPSLKIVAVTGWGAYEDRVRSRRAGIDAHLVKPLTIDDLNRALTA